jgi:hypothetical protein
MVVKIPKKLEMKSLLPAPCSPLPAHVLAFPPKGLGLPYVGFSDYGQAAVNEFYL